MPTYPVKDAALLLGVSDDTLRRWIEAGRLSTVADTNPAQVEGAELAHLAQELAAAGVRPTPRTNRESARNRFTGLVTHVLRDTVMAQVEIQAGPHRIVSLMSREAADDLELQPGVLATASIKSTNVVIETPLN